jgi:hypothetical protein
MVFPDFRNNIDKIEQNMFIEFLNFWKQEYCTYFTSFWSVCKKSAKFEMTEVYMNSGYSKMNSAYSKMNSASSKINPAKI